MTARATNDRPPPVAARSGRAYAIISPSRSYKKRSGQRQILALPADELLSLTLLNQSACILAYMATNDASPTPTFVGVEF